MRNFWKSRKLYFDIVMSFLILLIITCLAISWYTFKSNAEAMLMLSDDLVTQTSHSSIERTMAYLEQAKTVTELGEKLIQKPTDITLQNSDLVSFMRWTLYQYPYLSAFYIGTQDGTFLQLRRMPPNSSYRADPTQLLPGNAQFAIRYIERQEKKEIETWYYLDINGKILDSEVLNKVMYDHRSRDWYTSVIQSRSFKWSDVYVFSFNRAPGITSAFPIIFDNKIAGVIATDIEISQLSKFLKESRIGKYGIAYILTTKGEVIADSTANQSTMVVGDKIRMMQINDLPHIPSRIAYQDYSNDRQQKSLFKHDGQDYVSYFFPFPEGFNKNWLVQIVAPTDAFIGSAKQTNIRILLMSMLILIVSAVIIFLLARKIAKPIVKLANEAINIKNFKLDEENDIQSDIYEIQLLNESMTSMRQSMRTFSKFIPKILVSKLMKTGQELTIGGKTKKTTLFFSDVAGFTTISESYPADKLMIHLSQYFEEVTQIIMQNNGIIDKFIGDAVMAFWGAPTPDKSQVLHACKAALLFKKRLHELNRKWKFEGKPELPTRIGLHTGEVIIGNVGSSDRMNYTVVGDTVNLASRLEGVNKMYGTEIIISEEVYKEVKEYALARPLDVVAVKGKNKGIKIYELLALYHEDAALLPTPEQIEFCKSFTQGFDLYLEQRWDEALKKFQDIIIKHGEDQTAALYIKRCKEFKKHSPGKDWDGVIHLKTK
jgi:adenylate cyclase